ncbi:MAG: hypothetical protein LUE96_04095 [Lachnospiraceae bacterium]|nr:hypothetical protein [Lachnospiraceae bacterium]
MAKKFGKLALFSALAGAAAGTCYYYLKKKASDSTDDFDDPDDFGDFDEDLDDDFPDGSEPDEASGDAAADRTRTLISIDLDNAKEKIGGKVIETIDKTKEKLEQLNVPEKLDKAKEIINDKISSVSSPETEYTQMDMGASASSAYKGSDETADSRSLTEEFFDDTREEKTPAK